MRLRRFVWLGALLGAWVGIGELQGGESSVGSSSESAIFEPLSRILAEDAQNDLQPQIFMCMKCKATICPSCIGSLIESSQIGELSCPYCRERGSFRSFKSTYDFWKSTGYKKYLQDYLEERGTTRYGDFNYECQICCEQHFIPAGNELGDPKMLTEERAEHEQFNSEMELFKTLVARSESLYEKLRNVEGEAWVKYCGPLENALEKVREWIVKYEKMAQSSEGAGEWEKSAQALARVRWGRKVVEQLEKLKKAHEEPVLRLPRREPARAARDSSEPAVYDKLGMPEYYCSLSSSEPDAYDRLGMPEYDCDVVCSCDETELELALRVEAEKRCRCCACSIQ